ncbi:MAG: hypothetical protein WBB85_20500 [Albidovulum sp.]
MSGRLFSLLAEHEGQTEPQAIYSTSENTLRMMGRLLPRRCYDQA